MKAILVLFDSLNRHMLSPYGCEWVHTPNFDRLAERTVTFDHAFVGSMPCMPARRDLHTGRYNFLHRSWGPIEPFDESMPQILRDHGVYTHLISDHMHYWEDGGATYHTRYSSWELSRGQEGDRWMGLVDPWNRGMTDPVGDTTTIPEISGTHERSGIRRRDRVNRRFLRNEHEQPQAKTFRKGIEFMRRNCDADNWMLQIETFDPHEPFFSQRKYKDRYPHHYDGPHFDWPDYSAVRETPEQVAHCRYEYGALLSMCDAYLGDVLDTMDELSLWDDTMLIVSTDHGFLLGEHGWWAKGIQPFYNEISRIPLFIWDPRSKARGARRDALVQWIDFPPTLLEYFGAQIPSSMEGRSLAETVARDRAIREAALFGVHEAHVNCTDGRYVYMRAPATPENGPLYNYTLMPTHVTSRFSPEELRHAELVRYFDFTGGVPVLKIPARKLRNADFHAYGNLLFDNDRDPAQEHPLRNEAVERTMRRHMVTLMNANEAPDEQYERLGIDTPYSDEVPP